MAEACNGEAVKLEEILALEEAVWQALLTGDSTADEALLLSDFLGVYPSGFAGRSDHAAQLDAGPSVESCDLTDARLLHLGSDYVLLCYRADYRRTDSDIDEAMYVSSLWRRTADGWRNLFSQDTPATDTPVP